jgi:hypothetical protein
VGAKAEAAGALIHPAEIHICLLTDHSHGKYRQDYTPSVIDSYMLSKTHLALVILLAIPLSSAVARPWKSTDGKRAIQGEFLKRDTSGITIRDADQKEIAIPFALLHQDDRAWLEANHPLAKNKAPESDPVFDELNFGDKRDEVAEKLKSSKIVELTVEETFLGRTGLNGVFRSREKIGGLDASLFFDWDDEGGLKEITLQTTAVSAAKFNEQLKPCWKEFINLLTSLHGKPVNASESLTLSAIPDGSMAATHTWKLPKTGTALLGAAREGDQYQIAIRFTQKNIDPAGIPDPASF